MDNARVQLGQRLSDARVTGDRLGLNHHNIRGRHGFDVADSPAELQAEVSGRPRKTTGNQT